LDSLVEKSSDLSAASQVILYLLCRMIFYAVNVNHVKNLLLLLIFTVINQVLNNFRYSCTNLQKKDTLVL
jgi:hypothetical protein